MVREREPHAELSCALLFVEGHCPFLRHSLEYIVQRECLSDPSTDG
jgi:hypothetical protein